MSNGYERTYESIVQKLSNCDFDEAAARLGLSAPANGIIKTLFLAREYEISSAGVIASDGKPSDPNERSILIYYVTSNGSGEPSFSYCLPHYFIPGSLGGGSISWMTEPLARQFGNEYTRFNNTLRILGAISEQSRHKDEYVWSYRILPKIPMQIIYVEADDEFPCQIKLMLDNNAGKFMEFEQLAFLCGCLVKTISKIDQNMLSTT